MDASQLSCTTFVCNFFVFALYHQNTSQYVPIFVMYLRIQTYLFLVPHSCYFDLKRIVLRFFIYIIIHIFSSLVSVPLGSQIEVEENILNKLL